MKLNKPKFWDRKIGLIAIFLFPISLIYLIIIFLKKKFTKNITFNIPIICVGNIYIGGTGKTPTSILLAQELSEKGRSPVILRKFYKSHTDEYELIKNHFDNLILSKNRVTGIKEAEKAIYDCVILDDGFQDYKIKKDLNIICFNQKQLIGNGLALPSGPLRENFSALKNANIILINGNKNEMFEKKILNINKNLEIFYSKYIPINIDQFKNKNLIAIAGIGNPENFFELLEGNNLKIVKKYIFPDHYEFSKNELQIIVDEAKDKGYKIVTTEKDFFKIKNFKISELDYLKVSLKINDNDNDKFINRINRLYDKNN
jgi:tetraacyldisaccharide 4'-kinase